MIILDKPLSMKEVRASHGHFFETMVKIVVDIEKELVALDAELHADLEMMMLERGSDQKDLWGANIYFDQADFIEYTSFINIRPSQNNRSMEVQDPAIQEKIRAIVKKYISW